MSRRVLICGNPDLNQIDGSSIWAQTIALAAAATGEASVDFIAKSPIRRKELYGPMESDKALNIVGGKHSLSLEEMGELAIELDRADPYDVIIVRGLKIATKLLDAPDVLSKCWMYLTDIPQNLNEYNCEQRDVSKRLAEGCNRLLCQSDGFKSLWLQLAPDLEEKKISLYTPVIPDIPESLVPIEERPLQAIYAGKFKSEWMTLEMAEHWPAIHRQLPESELLMVGDKIHNEPARPEFHHNMKYRLERTDGLTWLGGQSREGVQRLLGTARVGLSWRAESMNETVEYSTKILEYGGAGCAAILNRNPLHEQLLGEDYPLYANNAQEFRKQLTRALCEPTITQVAANKLNKLAQEHTFSKRVADIRQWLAETAKPKKRTRVLVAGHDLKFFTLLQKKLEETGEFVFLLDQWQGHNKHNKAHSRALLEQADVIFCEWCLGNLKWYSHHKKRNQRLIARFHAQEARLPYLEESKSDNIDHIIFVSEHIRRQALERFEGVAIDKTSVIPNYLDIKKFTPKKKTGDARFTIGMVGVAPLSKRVDRALDLLESLLEEDSRYCLRVKGKHPLEYRWLLNRDEELAYYRQVFERINSSPTLRHKVIFDPPGDDVNNWFTSVGFILSPSDHESFHMAIGEGALTGATPIVWNWPGARHIWGEDYIVASIEDAKKMVVKKGKGSSSSDIVKRLSPDSVFVKIKEILEKK